MPGKGPFHPRWLVALGFAGLCTSFACFPPAFVAPIAEDYRPTGASPRPSPSPLPSPAASAAPSPVGSVRPAAAYFPMRAGTWRYRVATTPAGGAPIAGERTLTLADVVTSGDATTATATSTVKLNVPGFTALDEAEVRGQATRTGDRFALTLGGRTTAFPFAAAPGDATTENGLTVRLATRTEAMTPPGLGTAYSDVVRVEYLAPAAPDVVVAAIWFAPDVGPVRRLDRFTHDGRTWEAIADLVDHPGK